MEGEEYFGRDNDVELHISNEIVIDRILSRIPIKSLYKFRSVCKLWNSLPCDSKFVKLHNELYDPAPTLIVLSYKAEDYCGVLRFYSLDIGESGNTGTLMFAITLKRDVYYLEPSCRGLICFSSSVGQDIYVCNPRSRELLQLPKVCSGDTEVYSPCKVAGFGFDKSSNKYKVLCVHSEPNLDIWKCFIFTLGSTDNKWRQLDDIPYPIQPIQGAYLNGAVHWLIEHPYYSSPAGILAFSFEDEQCQLLPLPYCEDYMLMYGPDPSLLKVIGGELRLVATIDGGSDFGTDGGYWYLKFWRLEDYEKRVWTFECYIVLDILDELMQRYKPVPVDIRNDKVLLSSGKRLFIHDLKEKTTREIYCDFPGEDPLSNVRRFQPDYVERLVSIFGND